MTEPGESRAPLIWPRTRTSLDVDERCETHCEVCGVEWWVHRDLAAFRLRCECGAWVVIPSTDPVPLQLAEELAEPGDLSTVPEPAAVVPAAVVPAARRTRSAGQESIDPVAMSVRERQGRTNRLLFELLAMMFAFLAPPTVCMIIGWGEQKSLLMPFASMGGGLLVIFVGYVAGGASSFGALRGTSPRFFVEALAGAGIAAVCAFGWTEFLAAQGLTESAGGAGGLLAGLEIGWVLFVVAVCPAIFEEIAFRGLLQSRLVSLFGSSQGIVLTSVAFGLAHGIQFGLPLQLGIGLYLCWLRQRCGSLYPGMLLHFLYNATVVLTL